MKATGIKIGASNPFNTSPPMPSLNTKVLVANKNGLKEEATVRDVLILGQGKAFETLKGMDCFESLVDDLQKEKDSSVEYLTEKLRVARKKLHKARWWLTKGVYFDTPTEEDLCEAEEENIQASEACQQAYYDLVAVTGQSF
jgi:hypothetical protein